MNFIAAVGPYVPVISLAVIIHNNHRLYTYIYIYMYDVPQKCVFI